ncbi:MAG: polysaccharide biosynthesis tyrosine autokinase [Geothrix sp.]|nr:polysaccharide biosynthesis tyrosine autokinase [Geothrix sp.]
MNPTAPNDPRSSHPSQDEPYSRQASGSDKADEFNLGEIVANVWEGRYLILGSVFCFLVVGVLYALTASPVYQVEALLQTETQKTYGSQGSEFTTIEGPYTLPTVAQGEIEILKSNLILARVVENLGLDVMSRPILTPIIGKLQARDPAKRPKIDIESFVVPERMRGTIFRLIALPGGGYQWNAPDDSPLAQGRPGDRVDVTYQGSPLSLKVRTLQGKPGQVYSLALNPRLEAINDLRLNLQIEERGKNAYVSSNILWLSLQASDPERGAGILNAILNQYIAQTIERKAGQSSKALALLQNQRPALQAQLADAESRLNDFRRRSGAVDMVREGELFLQQNSSLEAQISALRQKRQELLRTYTEHSDLVVTTDQQISHLQAEARKVDEKVTALPGTQQEIVRLTRDAHIKSEMYTSLLNSIQQLQNSLAGSMGNARVVDLAIPAFEPIAPKKKVLVILFLFIGFVVGTGLTVLRRVFRRGIEDHRIIEAKLGLPILVTIPHSEAQRTLDRAILKNAPGLHLLAVRDSEDLATESLRSLRTVLHFTMETSTNRIILITGPSSAIGKSFVSNNLSVVLAQAGGRVLLVDADLRKGNLHRSFGAKRRAGGLSEVLSGQVDWKSVIRKTDVPGLSLISTGVIPPDPLVLLMSNRFSEFTSQVSQAFDFVIFDAPPLLPVTDAIVIGSKAEAILLVARYGAHSLDEFRTCQNRLKNLGGRLKGCVFNDIKLIGVGGIYGYYKYDYDYKYKKTEA